MNQWRKDRIGSALRGENPTVLARMPGGFAVMGDPQWLPGYCVLLTDNPKAERLSDLSQSERSAFLESMANLGEAVERACKDADAFLHAHVWPRYEWEPPELVHRPVWLYPVDKWRDEATALGGQHKALRVAITNYLTGR